MKKSRFSEEQIIGILKEQEAERRSPSFVWGAPFFLGRTVLLVMDGRSVPGFPGITGPFYAVGQGRDCLSKSPTR